MASPRCRAVCTTITFSSQMIGVCTDEFRYQSFTHKFVNLLGMDSNSWGISYHGRVQHNRQFRTYMPSFNQGDVVSVQLDMEAGTMLFAKNGKWYGPPMKGLRGKSVYPVLSSTSKRTCMRLIASSYTIPTLKSLCCSVVAGSAQKESFVVEDLSLPNTMKKTLNEYLSP